MRVKTVEGERTRVETKSGVELTGTLRDGLSQGDGAVAAIRPEDVSVLPEGSDEQGAIPGTAELVEFLGRDLELNISSGLGDSLVARTNGDWAPGSRVSLVLPPERLLVFAEED